MATTPTPTIAQKLPNCIITHTGGYRSPGRSLIARKIVRSQLATSPPDAARAVIKSTAKAESSKANSARSRERAAAAESGPPTRRNIPVAYGHDPGETAGEQGEGVRAVTTLADRHAPWAPTAPVDAVTIDE